MNQTENNVIIKGKYWLTVIFMAVLTLYVAGYAFADSVYEQHHSLKNAVKTFLHKEYAHQYELTLKFGRLDKRLQLKKCKTPLRIFNTRNRPPLGSSSIGIRCEKPNWKVHLPVHVQAYTNIIVAKRPIARGEMISKGNLTLMRHDVGRFHGNVFTNMSDLDRMVAKRAIRNNAVITARMVKPRLLVSRGEVITIVAEVNGLKIRTAGEALMDGHQGQTIRVLNNRSGRKISGEVVSRSTVKVKM